jgi:hypothetical protein
MDHRLASQDPIASRDDEWEEQAAELLLQDARVPLAAAARLV